MWREPGGEIKRGYIITINIIIFHNYDIMSYDYVISQLR